MLEVGDAGAKEETEKRIGNARTGGKNAVFGLK